jgi:hypothetical protein
MRSTSLYNRGNARRCASDSFQQFRDQRSQIIDTVRPRPQHDDGNRKRNQILLEGQIAIDRHKHVELFGC